MVATMNVQERERFSALLRGLRGDSSMRSYCASIGIHYAAWRQWEACESVPVYENLEKVANVKGWTMDQLLAYLRTGDENESPLDVEAFISYVQGLPDEKKMSLVRRLL